MGYTSDWHNIPISYVEQSNEKWLSRQTLESIVSLFEAHWKVEDRWLETASNGYHIPCIVNENLGYGFTWFHGSSSGNNRGLWIVENTTERTYRQSMCIAQKQYQGFEGTISNMQVCVPNAQNVVFKYYAGSERYNLILSAMKSKKTNEYETILLTRRRDGGAATFYSTFVCYSLNDLNGKTPITNNGNIGAAYNTNSLSRVLATACVYSSETLYESPNMYIGINDLAAYEEPISIVIDGIEYVGMNMNLYAWGGILLQEFNYYFKVESED